MTRGTLFASLEVKPGQETTIAEFLAGALPLVNAEWATTARFALKFGSSTFGVFDAPADEAGRQTHLNGPIAAALMAIAASGPRPVGFARHAHRVVEMSFLPAFQPPQEHS